MPKGTGCFSNADGDRQSRDYWKGQAICCCDFRRTSMGRSDSTKVEITLANRFVGSNPVVRGATCEEKVNRNDWIDGFPS